MSGQTRVARPGSCQGQGPSMEGRTIVRPDPDNPVTTWSCTSHLQWRAGQLSGQTRRRDGEGVGQVPPFNGGPDNCPARRSGGHPCDAISVGLQWRAGQLSGQTREIPDQTIDALPPSMEGRTIVRPDEFETRRVAHGPLPSMEGRTIVRPDVTSSRATPPSSTPFNGGPDNCPARPDATAQDLAQDLRPSMEGRTIVRPDRSRILGWFTCVFAGVCERCWKPKLRRELIQLSSCKKLPRPGFECSLGLGNAT